MGIKTHSNKRLRILAMTHFTVHPRKATFDGHQATGPSNPKEKEEPPRRRQSRPVITN